MKIFLCFLFLLFALSGAEAQTTSITPNAMTQFVDSNGAPLAGGKVYFYVPGTTTPSQTWQDPYMTTLNSNPITLDSSGRATIWGQGVYRQVVFDQYGNTIWDRLTAGALIQRGTGTGGVVFQNSPTINSPILAGTPSAPTANSGTNTTQVATTAFVASAVANALSSSYVAVTAPPYNAKCDGVTDDTNAFNTALATGQWVLAPSHATCIIAGTLNMSVTGSRLSGGGWGSTILSFTGVGTGDAITMGTFPATANCIGSVQPSDCQQTYNLTIDNMTINAPNRVGGFIFDINGVSQASIHNIYYSGWGLALVIYANNVIFDTMNGYTNDTTTNSILLQQPITAATAYYYRTDSVVFNNFTLNAKQLGASCMAIDGPVYTVRINASALLDCQYGIIVNNTALSATYYPDFLFANDLEIDAACDGGLAINAGADFHISNSYFATQSCNGVSGHYPLLVNPDTGFSVTHRVVIVNSQFHDSGGQAALIGAKDVTIDNSLFFDTNHTGTGTTPAIEILSSAQNILISNSFLGQAYGDPYAPNYGIIIDSGAASGTISLSNNNYSGATTKNVDNVSAATIGFLYGIGYNSSLISVTTCAATTAC